MTPTAIPGTPLIPDQRRESIVALVRRDSMLSFRRLAGLLGVSEMTIRRDVTALRAAGRVRVTPGGVKEAPPADDAAVLREQMTVHVAPGVPLRMLRPYLDGVPDLTVVTADLALVHALLDHPTAEIILLGGAVARSTRTTRGPFVERALAELSIDVTLALPGPPAPPPPPRPDHRHSATPAGDGDL